MNTSYPSRGLLNRLRIRLFGETDPVEKQLREIGRQGSAMAHLAHICAAMLVVLFSLGSLVSLAGDALQAILTGWRSGRVDIPSAISVGVSVLLVVAMDTGMLYAASVVRLLTARRAPPSERRPHQIIMVLVALLEAATYGYMSFHYEGAPNPAVVLLIAARAAAAPVLSIYLSMARTLPILPRDILYRVELTSGEGVLRQVTELANSSDAGLPDLLGMFYASADMSESDRQRLTRLATAVQLGGPVSHRVGGVSNAEPDPTWPTGGGSPVQVVEDLDSEEDLGGSVALERIVEQSAVVPLRPAAAVKDAPSAKRPYRSYPSPAAEEAAGFAVLDAAGWDDDLDQPVMSKAEFRRVMGINNARARELYTKWELKQRNARARRRVEGDLAQ